MPHMPMVSSEEVAIPSIDAPFPWSQFFDGNGADSRDGRRVSLIPRSHALRKRSEACIREVYKEAFGAHDLVMPRMLIALVGETGQPLCVAGLRTAGDGFFSEIYLDRPVESILSARSEGAIARQAVFEVTTLASRSPDASALFLRHLAILGNRAGFRWAFFTATARLRRLLSRLGIRICEIGAVDPARMPGADRWGSYYAHLPRVCAVESSWIAAAPRPHGLAAHA
jgi:Thermostable hemolysin